MRRRDLHPRFFTNDELHQLEVDLVMPVRVAFAGLWCYADREGRFEWRASRLKVAILPFDDAKMEPILDGLAEAGFIVRYEVDGVAYGWIPTFQKHQHVHPREAKSRLPACPGEPGEHGAMRAVDEKGEPFTRLASGEGDQRKESTGGFSGPFRTSQDLSGPSAVQGLGGKTAALRSKLPESCHEALRVVLAESGRGAAGAVLAMLAMLNPDDGTTGPNGRSVTPDELATALGKLAGMPNPGWNGGNFVRKAITTARQPSTADYEAQNRAKWEGRIAS